MASLLDLTLCRRYVVASYKIVIVITVTTTTTTVVVIIIIIIIIIIVSITKFSIVIGSLLAYLSRKRRAITWVSNYRRPI